MLTATAKNIGKKWDWRPLIILGALLYWLALLYGYRYDFLNPVFSSALIFFGSYVLGLSLIVWAVIWLSKHWLWRLSLILCGLAALVFLGMMPWWYGGYYLPVTAAPGYTLRWVTQPGNPYSAAYRQAQLTHEAECDYHLFGWSAEGVLEYTSECLPGIWSYAPSAATTRWSLLRSSLPTAAPIERWDGYTYLERPESIRLNPPDEYTLILNLERSVSPDGQWEAIVVRWVYGPSEIVVVRKAQ